MRTRRSRLVLALLTILAAAVILPQAPAGAHSSGSTHRVKMSGTIKLHDDETWPIGDEEKTFSVFEQTTVSTSFPSSTTGLDFEQTCCGEIRAVLDVTARLYSSGSVRVEGKLKLYEGVCESWVCNNDLDGVGVVGVTIPYNATTRLTLKVKNTDEGGDWIYLSVTLYNNH